VELLAALAPPLFIFSAGVVAGLLLMISFDFFFAKCRLSINQILSYPFERRDAEVLKTVTRVNQLKELGNLLLP